MTQPCTGLPRSDARLQPAPGRASSFRRGRDRLADGGGRRQRLRQIDADEGHRRRAEADGRRDRQRSAAPASPICRSNPSSTARFRHASSTSSRSGSGRGAACSAASPTRTAQSVVEGAVGGRPRRLREAADRHAVGRPAAARAVRARAGAGRRDHPARRAVQRDRFQDRRRPDRADQALARREAHDHGRRPRPQPGARAFSRNAAACPPAGRLGRHDRRR